MRFVSAITGVLVFRFKVRAERTTGEGAKKYKAADRIPWLSRFCEKAPRVYSRVSWKRMKVLRKVKSKERPRAARVYCL